jgi:parallel beta helix pectate lyase-like protein
MSMKGFGQKAPSTYVIAAFATLLPLVLAPTGAAACATKFMNCCTINESGTYTVIGSFPAPKGTQTCIDITASNVILNVSGDLQNLEGPGVDTGTVGIDIEASAKQVSIFNLEADNFGQGIRIDGPNATLNAVVFDANQTGIFVDGANALIDDSTASGNGGAGIQINKTATHFVIAGNVEVGGNGAGIELNGASGGFLNGFATSGNDTFGIWVNGASNNVITNFYSDNNSIAGVYLGCNPAGPDGQASCSKTSSNDNLVLGYGDSDSSVSSTGDPTQSYGIAVGLGNLLDDVLTVAGDGNLVDDALDENPSCGTNRWLGNAFTTSSPAPNTSDYCIN